ncbi:glycosyltransferase family 4 protein [Phormidesmis sp. 146-33]
MTITPISTSVQVHQSTQAHCKPRVLFVLGDLWGENGITVHLLTLSKSLIEQGWEVALACNLAAGSSEARDEALRAISRFEAQGIQHFFMPFSSLKPTIQNATQAVRALFQLASAIRQFSPDIVHVHSLTLCPYVYLMRQLYGIPYVSTCHLLPAAERSDVKLSRVLSRYVGSIFGDRMIAISSELQQAFEIGLEIPKEKIRLICHGVDQNYFRPPTPTERHQAREAFGLKPEDWVVCHVGRLAPEKGHAVLTEAIAHLRSAGVEIIGLYAGKGYGNEKAAIAAKVTQSGVSDLVRLLGMTDTRQVLWAADALVLPSHSLAEGFPLVIPEAMLCGVVPVRTPGPGAFDQIQDGMNGFIVPFNQSEELAARLKQLVEDGHLRNQMAEAAVKTANQQFTIPHMVQSTVALYQELLLNHIAPY